MYAKRLGQENARLKIEELLRSLLRGVYADGNEKDKEPFPGRGADLEGGAEELCGWKKKVLLKEVVLILGDMLPMVLQSLVLTIDRQISRSTTHHRAICKTAWHDWRYWRCSHGWDMMSWHMLYKIHWT